MGDRGASRGVVLMLAATCLLGAMGGLVKWTGATVPVVEVAFFRSLFGVIPVAIALRIRGVVPRPRNPRLVIWRGLVGFASMILHFYAIVTLPLSDAVLIGHSAPVFVAVLAPYLVGERTTRATWIAVAVSILGITILLRPRLDVANAGGLAALASGFFAALAYLSIRRLSAEREDADVIAFYFPLVAAAATGVLLLATGFEAPTPVAWAGLVATGLVGGGGQILMTRAYGIGPVSAVAAASYATVVVSWCIALVFFDEPLRASSLVGGSFVVGAGAWLAIRTRGAPSR